MSGSNRFLYYLEGAQFWLKASELQRTRCLEGTGDSDIARADINFYVVAVQRIREVARMAADRSRVSGAREALVDFDTVWPRFEELRNLEEHITGPSSKEPPHSIWYFRDLVAEWEPGLAVSYLIRVNETQEPVRKLVTALEHGLAQYVE